LALRAFFKLDMLKFLKNSHIFSARLEAFSARKSGIAWPPDLRGVTPSQNGLKRQIQVFLDLFSLKSWFRTHILPESIVNQFT
jgi:hypothetical protein